MIKRISVTRDIMEHHKVNICNNMMINDNDDNVMHASAWFEFFGGLIYVKTHDIWEET